jgi:hypothetical protein
MSSQIHHGVIEKLRDADDVRFFVVVHVNHLGIGAEAAFRVDDVFLPGWALIPDQATSAVAADDQIGTTVAVEIAYGFEPGGRWASSIHDDVSETGSKR